MTETTTQTLSQERKDHLSKAAGIIGGSFTFADTPSGFDYWRNACTKLYELSDAASSLGLLYESIPGRLGKGKAAKESSGYSGEIGSWKNLADAADYINDISWNSTSSGESYWNDVYDRVVSFASLAKERLKNEPAGGVTKGQEEGAKKASQPGFKLDPMALCSCGHAYHTHSKKRGCKFHAKDQCFKFAIKSVSDVMAVEPLAAPKPEDFLEL